MNTIRISLKNIENYLDFKNVSLNNNSWVEPIFITAYKAYLEENDKKHFLTHDYIYNMFTQEYNQNKSYSPIENIKSRTDTEKIAKQLSSIMIKQYENELSKEDLNDLGDYLHYLFTEMLNNVPDHSNSQIGGFAMAQYYPTYKKYSLPYQIEVSGF